MIEVRSADSEGRLEVRCFNPSPINVVLARLYPEGGVIKISPLLCKLSYEAKSAQII